MKKLILTSVALLSLVMLTGCSKSDISGYKSDNVKTHKENNRVIVKTFSDNYYPDYRMLDNQIGEYLSGIKNINDYNIKITSGGFGQRHYSEVFETVVLIKKG